MLAEHYGLIKNVHISLALLSGCLFMLRGLWGLLVYRRTLLQLRLNRLSYVIDTCLLLAALLLLASLSFAPLAASWLQAKLVLVLCYVLFGALAFRVQYAIVLRWLAYFAALICYMGIYYSARWHQPFAGVFASAI